MKAQKKAYLFAFAAIACWSTIGSAFKLSLRHLSPVGLLFWSSLTACIVLFILLAVRGRMIRPGTITFREYGHSAVLGLLNPFLYYIVLLRAYDILPAQQAGTLNYIWPLVLVLLSIPLLGQRISAWSVVAIFVSFSGILLIVNPFGVQGIEKNNLIGAGMHLLGVVLAVGSAVFWALYWILNLRDNREVTGKLFLNFCFGTVYTLIVLLMTEGLHMPVWLGLAGAVYIGIFEMGITFVFWLTALKYSTTTARVSNLIYLSPFISLIIIHYAVGETITLMTVGGLALLVSGIILQQYLKR